jgi:hypothetical protein
MAGKPDPRITEWPRPGAVESRTLSICPGKNKNTKSDFLKLLLDRGHFITGEEGVEPPLTVLEDVDYPL